MNAAADAARLGLLVVYAFDMHLSDRASLTPAPDARLAPQWKVLGYLSGVDALFRRGRPLDLGDAVCYGYLAQSTIDPTQFVVAIRGTEGLIEWLEDAQFLQIRHPAGGMCEAGFWGIYSSMKYKPIVGGSVPAAIGIATAVGPHTVTVVGHSLGAPLATYLTLDLAATLGERVSGLYFASPRPGDAAFVAAFDQRVANYQVWNNDLDIVPRVPLGAGYCELPHVTWISPHTAEARIRFDLGCFHHLVCILAELDYSTADWRNMPAIDQPCAVCIKGPNIPAQ